MCSKSCSKTMLAILFVGILICAFITPFIESKVNSTTKKDVSNDVEISGLYDFPALAQNGRSFGLSKKISGDADGAYPVVTTDGFGGVYVAWYNLITLELFFTCSYDYGKSWSDAIKICGGGDPLIGCSDPSVAVDRQNGYVYLVWLDNRTGHTDVYLSKSVDRGRSFESNVKVNDYEGSAPPNFGLTCETYVTVAEDGKVYVAWRDNRTDPLYSDIYFALSIDNGETFGSNVRIHPYEATAYHTYPWIEVDPPGIIYIVYSKTTATLRNIYLVKSINGGLSFEPPVKVNDDSTVGYRGKKEIAISGDGKIHVVWTDSRNWETTRWDVYFATSLDYGLSFGPNVCIIDDEGPTWQGTPSFAIDSDGDIHVAWEDIRNEGVTPTYFRDTYYAFSKDCLTFSENIRINYVPDADRVDCADPNMAIDSFDNLFIVWADKPYSDSEYGIYFAFSPGWTWPMFHHDQTHNGYSTSAAPNNNQLLWTYTTGGSIAFSSPAVDNGTVYIGSSDGKIYALNAFDGQPLWIHDTGSYADQCCPAVVYGIVYIGLQDNNVCALNATTGEPVWTYQTDQPVYSSPTVANGTIYVGSADGNFYALDATTGAPKWIYPTGPVMNFSCPAVVDGMVFIGSANAVPPYAGKVWALNATTGSYIWDRTFVGESVFTSPTVAYGKVYVGTTGNTLYALDVYSNGNTLWTFVANGHICSSPAVAYSMVYVGSDDNKVYALDAETGDLIWEHATLGDIESSPAVADDKVFVGSDDYSVYALDAMTGTDIWSYPSEGMVVSSPAIGYGNLYVGSLDGKVYAFGPTHDIGINSIDVPKTIVGEGFSTSITVTLENLGDVTETFYVAVHYNGLIGEHPVTLPLHASTDVILEWNTEGVPTDTYIITAYATPVPNEINTDDNIFIGGTVNVTIPGDATGDFYVDISDATLIGLYWMQLVPPAPANVDINGDGVIDISDATQIGLNWLQHA